MNDQLRNAGALVLLGLLLTFAGLAIIWLPAALVVAGVVLIVFGGLLARTRSAE